MSTIRPGAFQETGTVSSPWMAHARVGANATDDGVASSPPRDVSSVGVAPYGSGPAVAPSEGAAAGRVTRFAAALLTGLSLLGATTSAFPGPLAQPLTQAVQATGATAQPRPGAAMSQTRQTRDALVDAMIVRDAAVGVPDARDVQHLKDALSGVDTEVLAYARANGTRWVIVKEGQQLSDAGVLRPRDPSVALSQARAASGTANAALQQAQAAFDGRLAAVTASLTSLDALPQEMGGPGPGPALSRADEAGLARINGLYTDLRGLQGQRKALTTTLLEQRTNERVKIYNPSEGVAGNGSLYQGLVSGAAPHSPEQMARMHGAKTPEEVASFVDAVELLNRDRLPALRQQSRQLLESRASTAGSPAQQQAAREILAQGDTALPIEHQSSMILVPNLYYYRPANQPDAAPVVVDYHDYASLQQWNDGNGAIKHADGKVWTVSGEHFDREGMNTIVLRDTALTPACAVHELGHAVEAIISRTGAPFANALSERKEAAFARPGPQGYVTDYAATSSSENLSEGFALHYNDPRRLQTRDPQLSRLIESQVAFIRAQVHGAANTGSGAAPIVPTHGGGR